MVTVGETQARLLERHGQLRELEAAFQDASSGRGRLIVVEGAAGAGKSALIAEACQQADGLDLRVLRARSGELEREYAFGVVRQLFEPVLAATEVAERRRLLAAAAGPAEWILSPDPQAPSERGGAGFAALNGIYWLAANLAGAQPLLLVVDDAHWADSSSLRALNFLAARIADVPIALLVALRPAEPGAAVDLLDQLTQQPRAVYAQLGPLSGESVAHIVRERLPDADDELCEACHTATAGNPLYLHELLRSLVGDGALLTADAVRQASVPSLGERVVRRIARVSPKAPRLTAAMSVLGDGGRLGTAAALADVDPADAGRVAHELARIEVLAAEDPFAFVHPLVRRSVYDHLSAGERHQAHAAAAELLRAAGEPVEAVATHLAAIPPSGSSAAAATFVEAGQRALTQAAPDEAVRWLRRALEEDAPGPPPPAILAQLGLTEVALRDTAAIGDLQAAREHAEDLELRTRVAVALVEILAQAGQWESALAMVAAAEADVAGADPELVAEVAVMRALVTAFDPNHVDEFDRERDRYRSLAMGDGWAAHALAALLGAIAANRGEGVDEALRFVDRSLEGGRLLAERGAGGWATPQLLPALIVSEQYERALSVAEQVLEAGGRDGIPFAMITGVGFRGWVHALRGDLPAAEVELRTAMEVAVAAEMPMAVVTGFFILQDALLERPSLADLAALVEATELDPVFEDTWSGAMLQEVRGRLRLGGRDGGIADLRASGRTAAALRFSPALTTWRSALALALPTDEREEAMSLAAEELEQARASGMVRPQGIALRAAGMLEGGERGVELLRESVSLLEGSEARLEHARSLVELGAALRRRQRRADAREQLEAGMELARCCGAERLADRAQEELRAAGGRPRGLARSGPEALTASEARVVRLAAEGVSNSEIAQELFVSLKTVETHLSHAYRKLGLSGQGSRERLAEALDRRPSEGDG